MSEPLGEPLVCHCEYRYTKKSPTVKVRVPNINCAMHYEEDFSGRELRSRQSRAIFTSQHHNKLAEWLYEYKQLKHIRRNKMFDDLVDTLIVRLACDNSRFMPRKFSAVIEFGPFKEEASKPTDRKDLQPRENIGEVLRSKP